jgi:hypothetical protein
VGHHKRHRGRLHTRWGARNDGTITAVEATVHLDAGAYNYTSNNTSNHAAERAWDVTEHHGDWRLPESLLTALAQTHARPDLVSHTAQVNGKATSEAPLARSGELRTSAAFWTSKVESNAAAADAADVFCEMCDAVFSEEWSESAAAEETGKSSAWAWGAAGAAAVALIAAARSRRTSRLDEDNRL